ncbi:MAG: polymer-forming cytoskeletal protein [Acidobacteriota bacterium]|nr:polymer-forming cytoskeletal protein [Acidobacteriota bacterium]
MKSAEGSAVLSKSLQLKGDISGEEDLFVDGEMEGTIVLEGNRLTIGPNGKVAAEITVRDLVVFGKLTGDIHATGRVELRQSAAVLGNVFASRLSIEESAMFKGKVELTVEAPEAAAE